MTATCVAAKQKGKVVEKLLPVFHHPPQRHIRLSFSPQCFLKILVPCSLGRFFFVWALAMGKLFCCFLLSSLLFVMAIPAHPPSASVSVSAICSDSVIDTSGYSHTYTACIYSNTGQEAVVMNNEKATWIYFLTYFKCVRGNPNKEKGGEIVNNRGRKFESFFLLS